MAILDPSTGEESRNALISEIRAEIIGNGATITTEDIQGERRLAYRIHGSDVGFYIIFQLETQSGDFFALTKSLNLKRDMWRFIFVRIDE